MLPPTSFRLRAASLIAATLFLGAIILGHDAQAATVKCTDTIDTASPVLNNGFGFNPTNTRSQASSIDSSNVASLKVAYTHVANGATEKRGVPAVTNQTVYFSEGKDLVAANRASGCEYWRFSAANKSGLTGSNALRSSIHYLPPASGKKAMVFAGDFFGNAYGVDAQTGKQVWQAFMGADASRNFITGSFQTHNGTLFIPIASKEVFSLVIDVFSACCSSHGMLQAVDPYTGKVKWTFHTSGSAGSGTYDAKTGFRGPNGMSIWSTPTIDVANNAVLVGTGQHLSPPTTGNSDAIISLNADTGKVNWVFQATANDAWNGTCQLPAGLNGKCKFTVGGDYDFGAPPIVTKLPDGSPVIIAGAKNGVVYSLNPKTGAKNWERKIGAGGALGGIHWGMTVDSQRVYAAVSDIGIAKASSTASLFSSSSGNEATPGATPGVYALDIRTGAVLWEKHDTHTYQGAEVNSIYSAALSLSNDVLFAANLNGQIKALRASTGAELWVFDTNIAVTDVHGVAGHGGTIDASGPVPAGRDLFLNSGYSVFGGADKFNAGPGNVQFVFRLP